MLWGSLCATREESWGAGGKGGSGSGWNMPAEHFTTEVDFVQFNLLFVWDFPFPLWALFQRKAGNRSPFVRVHDGTWWQCHWWMRDCPGHADFGMQIPDTLIMFHLVSLPSALHSSSFRHPNDISLFLAQILSLHSSVAVRVCCWLGHWAELRKGGSLSLAKAKSSPWW